MDAGMTITLIIVSIILAILSGLFNAVSDLSSEGKLKFKTNNIGLSQLVVKGNTSIIIKANLFNG